MNEFMRNTDAFTWSMESDPRLRSTVVTVLRLDRTPDWDDVRQRFLRLSGELPMFRQRVVASPPPAPPRWQDCEEFDLDFHMRRIGAPERDRSTASSNWPGWRRWRTSTAPDRCGRSR